MKKLLFIASILGIIANNAFASSTPNTIFLINFLNTDSKTSYQLTSDYLPHGQWNLALNQSVSNNSEITAFSINNSFYGSFTVQNSSYFPLTGQACQATFFIQDSSGYVSVGDSYNSDNYPCIGWEEHVKITMLNPKSAACKGEDSKTACEIHITL